MNNDLDDLLNRVFGSRRTPDIRPDLRPDEPDPWAGLPRDTQRAARDALEDIRRIGRELESPEVRALTQPVQQTQTAKPARSETAAPGQHGAEAFAGLEEALAQTVFGQQTFLHRLVLALKRPYVTGLVGPKSRGGILVTGPRCTGRRLSLSTAAQLLAQRGVFSSANIAWMDLSLYPTPGEEKLFLQDLFMALAADGDMVVFTHYDRCHPGFLTAIANLIVDASHPLAGRYVMQNGRLTDVGGALVTDAVSALTPRGKYLVLLSHQGVDALAGSFGGPFVNALADVCESAPLDAQALRAIARAELNALAKRIGDTMRFALTYTDAACAAVAAAGGKAAKGAEGVLRCRDEVHRALAQYKLESDAPAGLSVSLDADGKGLVLDFGKGAVALSQLLPGGYRGDLAAVKAELNNIVGLDAVKRYILDLEDNFAVQKRRAQEGLKTGRISMHMVFTGNPGTGKTTIARLISRYLKAIGVLSGGQLVEVTRADLVGRYVGHTAPLTTQVIQSALGGVLFIDEAYSLYRGKDDSFGLECIDTLVKGMEDHRDDLVVILAGYTREMEIFLSANSGLRSRFPNMIEFPDYTAEELLAITKLQAHAKGYTIDAACEQPLREYFAAVQRTHAREAGNGRLARNKVEQAILNQSRRLIAEPQAELSTLLIQDFVLDDAAT